MTYPLTLESEPIKENEARNVVVEESPVKQNPVAINHPLLSVISIAPVQQRTIQQEGILFQPQSRRK